MFPPLPVISAPLPISQELHLCYLHMANDGIQSLNEKIEFVEFPEASNLLKDNKHL